jgi:hypothetical protein
MKMIMVRNLSHLMVEHPFRKFPGIFLFRDQRQRFFHIGHFFWSNPNAVLTEHGDWHITRIAVKNGEAKRVMKLRVPLGITSQDAEVTGTVGHENPSLQSSRTEIAFDNIGQHNCWAASYGGVGSMARREGAHRRRTFGWLIVIAVFLGYFVWALQSEEVFRVVSNTLEQTPSGLVVSGEVLNTAAAATGVSVDVTFFDHQGRQLLQETVTLDHLAAGATVPFRTQPKTLTTMKNYTIHVNTGPNMYGN